MMNLLAEQKTPSEINQEIAGRVREIRKRQGLSQSILSSKSGVSLGSLRRFEKSGEISLQSLTKLAMALNLGDEMEQLFNHIPYQSIEEVIRGQR